MFAVQATCWYEALHTDKTRAELCSELKSLAVDVATFAEMAQSLATARHLPSDVRQRACDVLRRYSSDQKTSGDEVAQCSTSAVQTEVR